MKTHRRGPALAAIVIFTWAVAPAGAATPEAGWPTTDWDVGCRHPLVCSPADEVYEEGLRRASVWLESLGFGPPALEMDVRMDEREGAPPRVTPEAYIAHVSDRATAGDEGQSYLGVYDQTDREIYLRSDAFFAMGAPGEDFDDPQFRRRLEQTFVPVHELFHAVQNGYQELSGQTRDWIFEGTADAVTRAYADEHATELRILSGERFYDSPLHRPADRGQAYGTYHFWLKVGKHIGSRSGVAYLRDVLVEDLRANAGLDGVDRALKGHGGLYELLPWFFTTLELDRFGEPRSLEADLPPGEREAEHRFRGSVNPVAGRSARLKVETSRDTPVLLEIGFAEERPDLHLLVDGIRYDRPGPDGRNVYRRELRGTSSAELNLVLANVASKAGESEKRRYELVVRLHEIDSQHRYFGWLRGDVGAAEYRGPEKGPLEWCSPGCTNSDRLVAAMRDNAEYLAYLYSHAFPGMLHGSAGARENLEQALANAPFQRDRSRRGRGCNGGRYYGRKQVDVHDRSAVDDAWTGGPVYQAVRFGHAATAGGRALSGEVQTETLARVLDSDADGATFAIRFRADTSGSLRTTPPGGLQGCLGNDGEARGFHTWGWVVDAPEPLTIRVALRSEAEGRAQAFASFLVMAVLDDEALVLFFPGERFEPTLSVAGGKLDALDGVEAKLAREMRDMSAGERAMLEQMMGPGFAERIGRDLKAAESMMTGPSEATLRLPGPPPDRAVARYYLVTLVNFGLDADTEDRRWNDWGTARVVARLEKTAAGGPPELPPSEQIDEWLSWPGGPEDGGQ